MDLKEIRQEMEKLCVCPQCPSFVGCKERIAFCLSESGKSNCIKKEKGCMCGGCPVEKKMGFKHIYYCTRGSEKDQSSKNK